MMRKISQDILVWEKKLINFLNYILDSEASKFDIF